MHGDFELIVFDEAHQGVEQIKKILSKIDIRNSKVVGFTATPYNEAMLQVFKEIVYEKDILWMINNGYLCEPKALQISTTTDLRNVKTVAGEFNQKQLEETVNTASRNDMIVRAYQEFASNRKKTLVFATGINHSNDLASEFNKQGLNAKSIDSTITDLERENILHDFKNGNLPILVNVGILTTGFDFPPVDCIIIARPTKSKILYAQIIGRGLRTWEGKDNCLIMDFKDVIKSNDLINMSSIFNMEIKNGETLSEAQARIEVEKEERIRWLAEQEKLKQEREEELRLKAEQIEMFNRDVSAAFSNAYYDWYKVKTNLYSVSENSEVNYVIQIENGDFIAYKINTSKDYNNQYVQVMEGFDSILEAIQVVENSIKNPKSFADKNALWKSDKATPKQLEYCRNAQTKWDCHKYFTSYKIIKLLEKERYL